MSAAIFAYKSASPRLNVHLPRVPDIFGLLKERDVEPYFGLLGEEAYTTEGIRVNSLTNEDSITETSELLPYAGSLVLINRMGRHIAYDQLPAEVHAIPVINKNATHDITNEKDTVYKDILKPIGTGIPAELVSSHDAVQAFIESFPAKKYILKPRRGSRSEGIFVITRKELDELDKDAFDSSNIVQPFYNFRGQLPPDLKPYDAQSREQFEEVRTSHASKELRVYGFHSPSGTETFAVGRAIIDGSDEWFFIDPDTLPGTVFDYTKSAIQKTAELSGAVAMLGTLDFGYGHVNDEPSDWHPIELNSKQPYVVGDAWHAGIAQQLRVLFADQIRATVQ